MQARFDGQSWLITHSGRQFGGAPNIPGAQEHSARLFTLRQTELEPHGLGRQGSAWRSASGGAGDFN